MPTRVCILVKVQQNAQNKGRKVEAPAANVMHLSRSGN